ncbi:hypothetical protein [Burkholderia sp. IDO3]|uniref:hypothetical protein n=1 Tax=Burkholderia sp. IDO3 TaxID=1705310 RepID=UPI000BBAFFA6|nr:hypothetical protein [Burkholderia sp. IDO3]AXK61676.1 hypothetical protein DCN14_02685 [Burkholderia sp. IDO3]PCD63077.1 hypothetical protein CN645_04765 [Burkholderia sp. IDO3]
MSSIAIELGSGKRATLTRAGSATLPVSQRAAVAELMLHWPTYAGLTTNAMTYLRQLGLDAFRGAPLDVLRSAIEDGKVAVAIERQATGSGTAGGRPSTPPFPRAHRLPSVAPVASLPVDKPLPDWARPSDVSAEELISYLEYIVGGAGGDVADIAPGFVDVRPLGDAAPFFLDDSALNDALSMAAVGPFQEEQCFERYEIDMEMCAAIGSMYRDPRTYALCKQRAFEKFQTCRGM